MEGHRQMTHPTRDPDAVAAYANKKLLDDIVNDYLDTAAALEKYEARKKQIAEEIASILGPGKRHEVAPGVGVTVSAPMRRWDPVKARAVLTQEQYASICIQVPDRKQAEALLPGALVEQCLTADQRPFVRRMT
jgi:hypothetical protein